MKSDTRPASGAASPAGFAVAVFLGSVVFLALTDNALAEILSINGLLFLISGTAVAALVVGVAFFSLQNLALRLLINIPDKDTRVQRARLTEIALMTLQVVVIFYATELAWRRFF